MACSQRPSSCCQSTGTIGRYRRPMARNLARADSSRARSGSSLRVTPVRRGAYEHGWTACPCPHKHSAGLPVRIALAKTPPPVVTVHRSSPAPSGQRRWRGYGGPTRAGTATHRLDEPKGLPATVCQPCGAQEPGRYRQQGPRRTERTVRTGRVACPCPLNVGLFGAGSDAPHPSKPGLPAGAWGG